MTNEQTYLDLLQTTLFHGVEKSDRTGTGTITIFGPQVEYDLQEGFPLLTTKRIPMRLVTSELLWFIRGDTNIRYLLQHDNHIWNEWAFKRWIESDEYKGPDMHDFGRRCLIDEDFSDRYEIEMARFCHRILVNDKFAEKYGDLGEIYGKQWRNWSTPQGPIDQLDDLINEIKKNPDSRRLILSAWNPGKIRFAALPPCHVMAQFFVHDNKLSCKLIQRSADLFLGVPFNIASYALLTHLISRECGLGVGKLVHSMGDAHIYKNHVTQVSTQLCRKPKPLPTIAINSNESIFNLHPNEIEVIGYDPHPTIKAPVSV